MGNRITAERWAKILRSLGHRVEIREDFDRRSSDLFIALHARKSARSILQIRQQFEAATIVLALTGTDLNFDLATNSAAQRSLELADRLVLLQPLGSKKVPLRYHAKIQVIYQSAHGRKLTPLKKQFEVCVCGHLRAVKDPFRAALAVRSLSSESKITITHLGRAMSESMKTRALRETERNSRYNWMGEVSHAKSQQILARSRLLLVSSKSEGAPSVVSEALASDVPIISTKIDGVVGILGKNYPGYFQVGNTQELRKLLLRCESDAGFYDSLISHCQDRASLIAPESELQTWAKLLNELF
jgi:putative glycosyltransferase (TIGR04348 family)